MKKKIAITGKTSRVAKTLKKYFFGPNIIYLEKKKFDILNFKQINNFLKKNKIKTLVHMAALSRPMKIHKENINKSIEINIIGTANIVRACKNNNTKLIFFSTNYVYPGKKGPYSENDNLNPINNYGWSKLGGESAVRMYKNTLILRLCMTEKPFVHQYAFSNVTTNFMFHDDFAKVFHKLINKKGVINVGGKRQTVFNFVKPNKKNVKKKISKDSSLDHSIDIKKFKKIIG
jgi:dTDP-4-dehydrorhamnose reductase